MPERISDPVFSSRFDAAKHRATRHHWFVLRHEKSIPVTSIGTEKVVLNLIIFLSSDIPHGNL